MERLHRVARTLGNRHPEIESIYLFGSLARGDAVPGSDADLLIVVSHSADPFRDRSARFQTTGVGVGVDVVVYTREELDSMLETGNEFVRRALREAILLIPVG
ncbi:MAG: nucleotidyltransferase domain-containing protein [Gemmatimonadetes bacterium]|nr:nucleotidyltransferase domain-containing protein [Gemmatimonadota bacterium]